MEHADDLFSRTAQFPVDAAIGVRIQLEAIGGALGVDIRHLPGLQHLPALGAQTADQQAAGLLWVSLFGRHAHRRKLGLAIGTAQG